MSLPLVQSLTVEGGSKKRKLSGKQECIEEPLQVGCCFVACMKLRRALIFQISVNYNTDSCAGSCSISAKSYYGIWLSVE